MSNDTISNAEATEIINEILNLTPNEQIWWELKACLHIHEQLKHFQRASIRETIFDTTFKNETKADPTNNHKPKIGEICTDGSCPTNKTNTTEEGKQSARQDGEYTAKRSQKKHEAQMRGTTALR